MSKLLQVSLNENFIEKLKRISKSKGISPQSYVKFVLANTLQLEDENEVTENGFLKKEEEKIYESYKLFKKEKKENLIKEAGVDEFLAQLP